jgi:hypothetical protein
MLKGRSSPYHSTNLESPVLLEVAANLGRFSSSAEGPATFQPTVSGHA